jgi:SAM-dependent methyltransferase
MKMRAALRPLMRPAARSVPPIRAAWTRLGRRAELDFWRGRPDLVADGHREWVYTRCFDVDRGWYRGKRLLDVGCGPRGSLDWADDAEARVGIDPLAQEYLAMGVDGRAMHYVTAVAEEMPFEEASFDVVSSINSLDHVDDVRRAAAEMVRVLRPGGLILIATELNHRSRLTEPQTFGWEVVDLFSPPLDILALRRYEDLGAGIDESLAAAVPYAETGDARPGVLVAKLRLPS